MANVIKWHHCSVPTNKCSQQHTSYSVTGHFNSLCAQLYWENINIYLHTGGQSLHIVVAIWNFMLHVWYMQQSSGNMHCWVPSWWRHQMETFSTLLALCAGNSPVTGEFPAQRPVMRSFDGFFDLHLYKRFSKQLWGWWFETPSRPLWCRCNGL